ncbi:MAG: hypothetical protein FD178_3698 [Ignavibacteria bacterium]|nr:MAG: hypothetical protein FD178_3698 [Ignavibacteria bacterium]
MKSKYLGTVALSLMFLIMSLPFAFAEELSRTYDLNGNLVSDGKYYREYNGLNQLVRIRLGNLSNSLISEEYKWHPLEERIVTKRVFSNGVLNYTVYYPNENYVMIVNSSGTFNEKYVYQDGVLVAQVNTDEQKQAVHNDHEGSNTLITDSSGNVVENTFYSPFGEILEGGKSSRYGYEGKEYDSLVEDVDFKFRKYNPKQPPIFNQPDTLIQNVYDPQSLNRYAFERNNPFFYIDQNGHFRLDVFGLGLFSASAGLLLIPSTEGISLHESFIGFGLISASFGIDSNDDELADKTVRTFAQVSFTSTALVFAKDIYEGKDEKAANTLLDFTGVSLLVDILNAVKNIERKGKNKENLDEDTKKIKKTSLDLNTEIAAAKKIEENKHKTQSISDTGDGGTSTGGGSCTPWWDMGFSCN